MSTKHSKSDLKYVSNKNKIKFHQLFKYASKSEGVLFIVGLICSVCVGCSTPVMFLLFADLFDTLNSDPNAFKIIVRNFAILGAVTFVVAFFQMFCTQLASKMVSRRIRELYYDHVLQQDVLWFDEMSVGNIITQLTEGVDKIETGIGEKMNLFVQYIVVFVSGIIIGYTKNWRLALVASAMFPLVVASILVYGIASRKLTIKERQAYAGANGIASEVLQAIKTIFAFEGQKRESERYSTELQTAERMGIKKSTLTGLVFGTIDCSMYCLIAVTLYYGMILFNDGISTGGDTMMVVFAMLVGGMTLGQAFQQLEHFNNAKAVATEVFSVIDRVPSINKEASGLILDHLKGNIELKRCSFEYPLRNDIRILNKVDLTVPAGKTVAIVGPSGSGKSTVIQLVQRFYDAVEGAVLIDGHDIKEFDIKWFRSQLGVVSQEPVLFAGTVSQNIRLGRPNATQKEIEVVAKMARAHDFITKLPEGYDTFIAEGGSGMSGGQKQRLAIARALIRDPRILLLDEATSALDTKSEKAVQRALDNAREGRTVVVVAHRLSTIRDADEILVMDRGKIREQGTHDELMALNGIYAHLVNKSGAAEPVTTEEDEDDDDVTEILKSMKGESKKLSTATAPDDDKASSVSSFSLSTYLGDEKEIRVVKEVLRVNKPELNFLIFGFIMAAINGVVLAGFTLTYTQIYGMFGDNLSKDERLSQCRVISGILGALAAMRLIGLSCTGYFLGTAAERLTRRLRTMLFDAILRQEVGWFDEQVNQPGVLVGRLAADVPMLQNVSGRKLGGIFEIGVLFICSLIIAFVFSWQIALVSLAFLPILVVAGAFEMRNWTGNASRINVSGAGVANESLTAARTVFSLGAEDYFISRYNAEASMKNAKIIKSSVTYSFINAIANSLVNFEFAAAFYLGGKLISDGTLNILDVFRSYTAISFACSHLGHVAAFVPDAKKAMVSGQNIFEVVQREPLLLPDEGEFPDKIFNGQVSFHNICFSYPTRKKTKVLSGFKYEVPKFKSVAFVGQSGCGKSTLLQLVQRFYDPNESMTGENAGIYFDGMNLNTLAPNWIRRQIGVVSQEPNLIDMTIRENIAYGLNHEAEVPLDRVIEAAKLANAHNFIEGLPQGYDTPVGARGSHLSGGQKQRIAIARALVRRPRLLILDEATAALDNESERIVQAALDEAMLAGQRTTLVVAHRLTTVTKCDLIAVLEEGKCAESGPPHELLATKGKFWELNNVDVNIKHK